MKPNYLHFPYLRESLPFYSSNDMHICQFTLNLVQIQLSMVIQIQLYMVIYNWKRLSQNPNKHIETLRFLSLNFDKHGFWFLCNSMRSNYAFIHQIKRHFLPIFLSIFIVFAMWSSAGVRDNKAMLSNRGSNS